MKAYFDANVIIYAAEGEGHQAIIARRRLGLADEGRLHALTSELTIAEVTAPSRRVGSASVAQKIETYTDLLVDSGIFQLIKIDMDILLRTPSLRSEQVGLRLIDAIHMATALETGCEFMVTNDRRIRSRPELMMFAPTEAGFESLLSKLA